MNKKEEKDREGEKKKEIQELLCVHFIVTTNGSHLWGQFSFGRRTYQSISLSHFFSFHFFLFTFFSVFKKHILLIGFFLGGRGNFIPNVKTENGNHKWTKEKKDFYNKRITSQSLLHMLSLW